MPNSTVKKVRKEDPVLRIVMNFGKLSLLDMEQALSDIGVLTSLAEDMTRSLGIKQVAGELVIRPRDAGQDEDIWKRLEGRPGDSESIKRGSRTTTASFGMRETWWGDGRRELEFRSLRSPADMQVKYVKFTNPLELWLTLISTGGVFSTVVLIGTFLRDYKAKKRTANAKADQEEAKARSANATADVDEASSRTLVSGYTSLDQEFRTLSEIQQGIRIELLSLQGSDLGAYADSEAAINALLPIEKLQVLARIMNTIETIEITSGRKIPK